MLEVLIEEFFIVESWHGIDVRKSLKQDRVYVKGSDGKWIQYGLLGHASGCLTGLVGSPKELGDAIAAECEKQKGCRVRFGGVPEVVEEAAEVDDFQEEGDDE
jgi:hypothetical protein